MKASVIISAIAAAMAGIANAAGVPVAGVPLAEADPKDNGWSCSSGWTQFYCQDYSVGHGKVNGKICIYIENWSGDVIWKWQMCCPSDAKKFGGDGTQPNSFNLILDCYFPRT